MRPQIISASILLLYFTYLASCSFPKPRQYTVNLTYPDGTTETHAMTPGSILLIHHGDRHYITRFGASSDTTLDLQITRYRTLEDSLGIVHSIKKMSASTNRFVINKKRMLGDIQVEVNSMASADFIRPTRICQSNCCEASCYSTICCADFYECKNTPCDCKPATECPGKDRTPAPARFFDMFLVGKDMMVLESVQDSVR